MTEPLLLAQLALLRQDLKVLSSRLGSVVDPARSWEIYHSENPIPAYVDKLRKLAGTKPASPLEFECLVTIIRIAQEETKEFREARRWAFQNLLEKHDKSELLGGLMLELCRSPSKESAEFMRAVIARSPHRNGSEVAWPWPSANGRSKDAGLQRGRGHCRDATGGG